MKSYIKALSGLPTNADRPILLNLWDLRELADLFIKGSNKLDSATNFLMLSVTDEFLIPSHRLFV